MTTAPTAMRIDGVTQYVGEIRHQCLTLDNLTFQAAQGEFLAVIGPSGCGKSTLLRLMGGLLDPHKGAITYDDTISATEARQRGHFSYGFQNPALLPWFDVEKNVGLPGAIRGAFDARPTDLLAQVGLEGFGTRMPIGLSGGEKQRVALARALTTRPRTLLLDEPFGALDDITREGLDDLVIKICARNQLLCVLVTHNLGEAVYLADRILVLSSRPAHIRTILTVPFDRPRSAHLRDTPEFHHVVANLRRALK